MCMIFEVKVELLKAGDMIWVQYQHLKMLSATFKKVHKYYTAIFYI